MKSLAIIQKIVKVLKILNIIAFVICIIGAVFCAIGAIALFAVDETSELWQTVLDTAKPETIDMATARCSCLVGVIVCAAAAALSWFSKKLYADELAAGTPFDRNICKETLKVGIIYLVVSLVATIIVAIICACFDVKTVENGVEGFSTGIFYIVCWLLFRYGADVKEGVEANAGFNGGSEAVKPANPEDNGNNGDELF